MEAAVSRPATPFPASCPPSLEETELGLIIQALSTDGGSGEGDERGTTLRSRQPGRAPQPRQVNAVTQNLELHDFT